MRDVRGAAGGDYAAHTAGRNSYAVGIAVCCMAGATPQDFGKHPITSSQISALCSVSAYVARWYRIGIACIQTHAEVALVDGYYGAGADDRRWDLARLAPARGNLIAAQAEAAGDFLRAQIAAQI